MKKYIDIVADSYTGYWNYLKQEVLNPGWHNYFYWLLGLSFVVWMLEIVFPWREEQGPFRKDFWLDGFYMFFNFFLLSLIGYNAVSNVAVQAFSDLLALFSIKNQVALHLYHLPVWSQYMILFVLADFIQWNIHRMLHRSKTLWEFHKVHHSVEVMGFAAHLRFHWMETVIYKTIQYIPLSMIGFSLQDFFIMHIFAVAIGHLNHSNLKISYGPLKYIFNNPVMHIWHHARNLPDKPYGVNYGLSISAWDYIFKTAYIPFSGKNEPLGFTGVEAYPDTFFKQLIQPFKKSPNEKI